MATLMMGGEEACLIIIIRWQLQAEAMVTSTMVSDEAMRHKMLLKMTGANERFESCV